VEKSQKNIAKAAKNLIIKPIYYHFPAVDSTNTTAKECYDEKKLKEGSIVYCSKQQKGKGRGNNAWYSSENESLCFSIILEPLFLEASNYYQLHKLTSISLIESLESFIPEKKLQIKWPNDIYFEQKKLGGILISNNIKGKSISLSIIGLGLNINQDFFPKDLINPVSLKQIYGKDFLIENILKKIGNDFFSNYRKWKEDIYCFDSAYQQKLYKLGEKSRFIINNKDCSAVVRGVNEDGKILLEHAAKINAYDMDEVKMLIV
jgi:BirA family transcriptional regulator, biotin operon repressor / biotin---[acetyl-CoA-carboxylase] ligase